MVTENKPAHDSNVTVGKLGPDGASKNFRINKVLLDGRQFRLLDQDGNLLYNGYLIGNASGREPLTDYGASRGCKVIEFEKDGKWIRLLPPSS